MKKNTENNNGDNSNGDNDDDSKNNCLISSVKDKNLTNKLLKSPENMEQYSPNDGYGSLRGFTFQTASRY